MPANAEELRLAAGDGKFGVNMVENAAEARAAAMPTAASGIQTQTEAGATAGTHTHTHAEAAAASKGVGQLIFGSGGPTGDSKSGDRNNPFFIAPLQAFD